MAFMFFIRNQQSVVSYNLVPSATSVDEGQQVIFILQTTGVASGELIPYTITGIAQADLSSGSLTGNFVIGADGTGSIALTIAADSLTEGPEVLTLSLDNGQAVAQVTINDTSTAPIGINWQWISGSLSVLSIATNGTTTVGATGGGPIVSTDDDASWDLPSTTPLGTVVWTGTNFVAAGNVVLSSNDGFSWTQRRGQTSGVVYRAAVANPATGVVVLGGTTFGQLLTSTDHGLTWQPTFTTVPQDTMFLGKGAYSSSLGLFVIGGTSGRLVTSPDGINWTARTTGTTVNITSVAWSPELAIFVGVLSNGGVITSTNGINWVDRSGPGFVSVTGLTTVFWDGTAFLAGGGQGAHRLARSTDGINWTAVNNVGTQLGAQNDTISFSSLTLNPNTQKLLAATNIGVGASSVANFSTWSLVNGNGPIGSATLTSIWDGNKIIACRNTVDSRVYVSTTNGRTWQSITIAGMMFSNAVVHSPELSLYIIGGVGNTGGGRTFATSTNGIDWSSQTMSPAMQTINGIAWSGTRFVAVGNGGNIVRSGNGINWGVVTSPTTSQLNSIAWSSILQRFVAVGNVGTIITSTDGLNWSIVSSSGLSLRSVTATAQGFVAVGESGTIRRSTNGTTWLGSTSGTSQPLNGVLQAGNQLIAVGNSGTILTSNDHGATWSTRNSTTLRTLTGVVQTSTETIAVGDSVVIRSV